MITTMHSDQNVSPLLRVEVIKSVQRRRRWPTAVRHYACDREVIAWLAMTTGLSGRIIASAERRFGMSREPHPVEWLSGQTGCTPVCNTRWRHGANDEF